MLEKEKCYGLEITGIKITDAMWNQWDWSKDDDDSVSGNGNQDAEDSDEEDIFVYRGEIKLTLRLDHCSVHKMYWNGLGNKFDGDCSTNLAIEDADMVILAGGEKDKEKGIECHKKMLSGTIKKHFGNIKYVV